MNVRFEGFDPTGLAFLDDDQARLLDSVRVATADVLLNITGASIGRVTRAPASMDGARVNQHVCITRPIGGILSAYIECHLASPEKQAQIFSEEYGVTRQALTKEQIVNFTLPLAPVNEQHRLIAKLEELRAHIQKAREALDAVPALLEKLKQSVFSAAFRGDLTAEWRAAHPEVEPASVLLDRIRAEADAAPPKKGGRKPRGASS